MKHVSKYLLVLLLSGMSFPLFAHHSHVAQYVPGDEKVIEGRIVQFTIRNPHSVVQVVAQDEAGNSQRWVVEWGSITALGDITRETLKPGDEVVVTGRPARDKNSFRLLMLKIERPSDGWFWSGTVD